MKARNTPKGNVKITLTYEEARRLRGLLNVSHLIPRRVYEGRHIFGPVSKGQAEEVSGALHEALATVL
jgi:hypothetical protein